eukprot:UN25683
MGYWNNGDLIGAIDWTLNQYDPIFEKLGKRQVYFTNYSYLGPDATPELHLKAMQSIAEYAKKEKWKLVGKVFFSFPRMWVVELLILIIVPLKKSDGWAKHWVIIGRKFAMLFRIQPQ